MAAVAVGCSTSVMLAAGALSAATQSKIVDTGSSWASALSVDGAKLPVIVEFAMPALPDLPATASEGDRDKAHITAVRAVQERILAGVLGSSPSALAAAQSSPDTNLKLMPFSPQFAMNVSAEELDKIAADPSVVKIYEDKPVPALLDQSVPLIGMPNAYAQGATGNGFRVAVLDTGARRSHEFLNTRVTNEACFNTNNPSEQSTSRCPGGASSSTATGSGEDCNSTPIYGCGHGTHVSGISAGFNSNRQAGEPANGVARDGRILAINVFSQFALSACGTLSSQYTGCVLSWNSDQIAALNYVNSVRSTLSIASVNMSIGGGAFSAACDSSQPQTSIINTLTANNVAVVIAAGNDGLNSQVSSPGCISAAITVASSTKTDQRSYFSNWGNLIDVVAPGGGVDGQNILSSYTNQTNGYSQLQGTTMAAPHVAGVWAALRSRVPSATVAQIEAALESTGLGISSAGVTKPRVRVDLALAQLLGTPPPANNDTFANRTAITPPTTAGGTVTVTGNNTGYTKESGEPNHYSNTSNATTSAWWRYTPATSGQVTISTAGSGFDTILAIYTGGTVGALTAIASNDDFGTGLQSQVTFAGTAGVQYQIAVAGYNGASGSITLAVTGGGGTAAIARIVASVTPVARATQFGPNPADGNNPYYVTAFASVTNAGTATATNCTITKPADGLPYTLIYAQRLPPSLTSLGATNAPFSLAPGDANAKHFLLVLTPSAAMQSNIRLVFDCANTDPAPTYLGVNSFQLTATATPIPDVIATVGTPGDGGIISIPVNGGRVVAMAAMNIGQTATVTARLSTTPIGGSTITLPLTLGLCRTNPTTGICLANPTTSPISFSAPKDQVNTFTAFINHSGAPITWDPATKRVYIQFFSGSTPIGSASIAVQTSSSGQSASLE